MGMKWQAYEIKLYGIIQGVGFRPFVYTLAHKMGLNGYVQNCYDMLLIHIQCAREQDIQIFLSQLLDSPPPNALITRHTLQPVPVHTPPFHDFTILSSPSSFEHVIPTHLPNDLRICTSCLDDMRRGGRFESYAFTTCTNCGARYSIIQALPYDRVHTSMNIFTMCKECEQEYTNPHSRRFHAQPNSCHNCAITLSLHGGQEVGGVNVSSSAWHTREIMRILAAAIVQGKIVAIKGVGGFNLVVSAAHKNALRKLRERKNRPHKPFALMFKNIEDIQSLAHVSEVERKALLDVKAPIVLLQRKDYGKKGFSQGILDSQCLELIAPNVATLGAILPYNGIMHLLFEYLKEPIVFTSANLSGEPIISDFENLKSKLGKVYDLALDYNREICNPIDDSIVRCVGDTMRVIRLARGYAPLTLCFGLDLQRQDEKYELIRGVGAQQKVNMSYIYKIQKEDIKPQDINSYELLLSPYIGDLESVDSLARYKKQEQFFSTLFGKKSSLFVRDLHPRYASTQYVLEQKQFDDICSLAHHKAHLYAALGECDRLQDEALGLVWDGTGLGEDGSIWGGECLHYVGAEHGGHIQRVAHFEPFILLGGEGAAYDIGKLALSLMWHYGIDETLCKSLHFTRYEVSLLRGLYQNTNNIKTSSVGRIFDAVAYILGLIQIQSYEGQSGSIIESEALKASYSPYIGSKPYAFCIGHAGVSCEGIVRGILEDMIDNHISTQEICARFIETLAHIALKLAQEHGKSHKKVGMMSVYCSGGVFQNKLLSERILVLFEEAGIECIMHKKIPCNDGGISAGQAIFGLLKMLLKTQA